MLKHAIARIPGLLRWLLSCALLSAPLAAQVDIHNTSTGPVYIVARNVTWAGSGQGAINNNFILDSVEPGVGLCVQIQNNDSLSHTFGFGVWTTPDPAVTAFAGNSGQWVPSFFLQSPPGVLANGIAATSTGYFSAPIGTAAHVAIAITGGSGASTASIIALASPNGGCSGTQFSTVAPIGPQQANSLSFPLLQCSQISSQNVAAGATVQLIQGTALFTNAVCGVRVAVTSTTTTAGTLIFLKSTTGTCASPSTLYIDAVPGTAVGANFYYGSNTGMAFTTPAGAQLCVVNNSTGGTVQVTVFYTAF